MRRKSFFLLLLSFCLAISSTAEKSKSYKIENILFSEDADAVIGALRNNSWIEKEYDDGYHFIGSVFGMDSIRLTVATFGNKATDIYFVSRNCDSWEELYALYQQINSKVQFYCGRATQVQEPLHPDSLDATNAVKLNLIKSDSCEQFRRYGDITVNMAYDTQDASFQVFCGVSYGFTISIDGTDAWRKYFNQRFMGLPLYGSSQEFLERLEEKGFTPEGKIDGVDVLKGQFAGIDDCLICVEPTDSMYQVIVALPQRDKWNKIQNDFDDMKFKLSMKYGPPEIETEQFDGADPHELTGDEKLRALYEGDCKYHAEYGLTLGAIVVDIVPFYVRVAYVDISGWRKSKATGIDDL